MGDEVYLRRALEEHRTPRAIGNRHAAKRERLTRPAFYALVAFVSRNPKLSWWPATSTDADLTEARILCAAALDERRRLPTPIQHWLVDLHHIIELVDVEIDKRICDGKFEAS